MIKKYKDYNKEDLKVVILKNFEANFPHLKDKYNDLNDIPFNDIANVDNWLKYWGDELDFIDADICDRMLALAQFYDKPIRQIYSDIEAEAGNYFLYDGREYRILTESEADDLEYETVLDMIESNYMYEIKDSPARDYVDVEQWAKDWFGNRGNNLAWYDRKEHTEEINGVTYYLYRLN